MNCQDSSNIGEAKITLHNALKAIWKAKLSFLVLYISISAIAFSFYIYDFSFNNSTRSVVRFAVRFPSVERDQYPNGDHFSPADIVAPVVLADVYTQYSLLDKIPFSTFSKNITILREGFNAALIEQEYESKLSDKKINAVQRDKYENEYQAKLNALPSNQFALYYTDKKGIFTQDTTFKILQSILETWAEISSRSRGAFSIDVAAPSRHTLDALFLKQGNEFIQADRIQGMCITLRQLLDKLRSTPRFDLYKTGNDIRIVDLETSLQEIQEVWLTPYLYAAANDSKPLDTTAQYIDTRLQTLGLEVASIERSIQNLTDTMNTIAPSDSGRVILPSQPQAGDGGYSAEFTSSFLESILKLSSADDALRFRIAQQNVLTERQEALNEAKHSLSRYQSLADRIGGNVKRTLPPLDLAHIQNEMHNIATELDSLIQLISETAYNPASAVFTIATQSFSKNPGPALTSITAIALVCMLLGTLFIALVTLYRHSR